MTSFTGLSPNNPRQYTGAQVALGTVVTRTRAPTGADYRQPETGKLYPFNTFWLVGKDPTTGTQGDLWYLSKIAANVAYWVMIGTPTGVMTSLEGDDTNVVVPTGGIIQLLGETVANGANPKPVYTKQNGASVEEIDVQVAAAAASSDVNNAGLASFDSDFFSVDADGFVTAPGVPTLSNGYFRIETGVPDVTGDNTTYTILYDSAPFHNGTDITYNGITGEFTVNTAGIYHIDVFTTIQNFNNGIPDGTVFTNTFFNLESGHSIGSSFDNSGQHFCPDSGGSISYMISGLLQSNVNDTFRVTIQVAGGTKVLQAAGNFGAPNYRDGNYLCYFRIA